MPRRVLGRVSMPTTATFRVSALTVVGGRLVPRQVWAGPVMVRTEMTAASALVSRAVAVLVLAEMVETPLERLAVRVAQDCSIASQAPRSVVAVAAAVVGPLRVEALRVAAAMVAPHRAALTEQPTPAAAQAVRQAVVERSAAPVSSLSDSQLPKAHLLLAPDSPHQAQLTAPTP